MEHKAFVIYVATLNIDLGDKIYSLRKAQIAYLKADEAFIEILGEYTDFADFFLLKLVIVFLKYTRINNDVIKLVDD